MKIASLVVHTKPEHIDALSASLRQVPGVQVHGANVDQGRVIVTVEDGDGYRMEESILAVNGVPHVVAVTLAYEYTDEGLTGELEPPEPIPGLPLNVADGAGGAQDKEA